MTDPDLETAGLAPGTFDGQVAVVTGAGQGIGRAVARTLAHLGARVVVVDVTDHGAAAAAAITAAGGQALFVRADVADPAAVAALAQQATAAFGPVDILINNAIVVAVAPVVEMPLEVWDRTVAVNLRGAFLTCRAFLPAMLSRGRGTIVNMVSTEAMPGLAAYIASKQGLAGFSQSLAAEVGGQGVRVVAFAPGMVDTPGLRSTAGQLAPRLGLSEAEFLALSLHPAYSGLMPASHAAAATAYLVARLADDYHGEVVTGYTVLEQAGVIAAAAPPAPPEPAPRPAIATTGRRAALEQAVGLCGEVHQALQQAEFEFERLPVFVRPVARGAFKSRVGARVQDVTRAVAKLREQLDRMRLSHTIGDAEFEVDFDRLTSLLERLQAYWQAVPAETARFSSDAAFLRQVAEQSARRAAVIDALRAALKVVHG